MRPLPRTFAAVLAVSLPLVALPAAAHDNTPANGDGYHTVEWGADAPNDGDRIHGTDFVTGVARFYDDVASWEITIQPEAGGEGSFCRQSGQWSNNPYNFRCDWDTKHLGDMSGLHRDQTLPSNKVAPNGRYIITVTVNNTGGTAGLLGGTKIEPDSHVLQPSRVVIVQNPVSAPTGVGRSYDSNTGKVTVTWAPSPEPDIQKYVIQEKRGSGSWENVGEAPHGATSFDRQIPDVGTYQYRVAAVRPEVAQSGFTETEALEVAAPPAPPPSDAPAEALGPEPGVTNLEPPTTATTVQAGAVRGGARPPGGGSLFNRPSVNALPRPPAPKTTPTTVDTGYSDKLPYDTARRVQDGVLGDPEELAGGEQPESMTKLITVPRPRDPRALLVPLAGGLTIFVFAMQMTYFVRRRPALVQVDDDFGDWMGI